MIPSTTASHQCHDGDNLFDTQVSRHARFCWREVKSTKPIPAKWIYEESIRPLLLGVGNRNHGNHRCGSGVILICANSKKRGLSGTRGVDEDLDKDQPLNLNQLTFESGFGIGNLGGSGGSPTTGSTEVAPLSKSAAATTKRPTWTYSQPLPLIEMKGWLILIGSFKIISPNGKPELKVSFFIN